MARSAGSIRVLEIRKATTLKDDLKTHPTTEHIQELETTDDPEAPRVTTRDAQGKVPCPHCGYRNSDPFRGNEDKVVSGQDTHTVRRCSGKTCRREVRYTATREMGETKGERAYRLSAILEPKPKKLPHKIEARKIPAKMSGRQK